MQRLMIYVALVIFAWLLFDDSPGRGKEPVSGPTFIFTSGPQFINEDSQESVIPIPTEVHYRPTVHAVKYGQYECSCVSVGGGDFLTAAHLAENATSATVEVGISGKWIKGQFKRIAFKDFEDLALVHCENVNLPKPELREAKYGEHITVFGLKTHIKQSGIVSDEVYSRIALDKNEPGIDYGDSGGAVLSDDDCLVGILTGFVGTEKSGKFNKRVVYFNPIALYSEMDKVKAASPGNDNPQPDCSNGQCNNPQTQRYYVAPQSKRFKFF